nr:HalOD1 output domain-containing protein [Halorussus sp. JP-T4]
MEQVRADARRWGTSHHSPRSPVSRASDSRLIGIYSPCDPLSRVAITTSTALDLESPPVAERRHVATDDPLSRTVYRALADAEGVDPTDLDFELYRNVDVDALDALFRHASSRPPSSASDPRDGWSFSFCVAGYQVAVESDGRVAVYEAPRRD